MKSVLFSLSFLFATTSFATNIGGGQIYWEALGNNQYVFYLDLLESHTYTSWPSSQINTNIPGLPSISVTLSSFEYIGDTCVNPSSANYEGYFHLNSGIVTIPVPVGNNPWIFSYSSGVAPAISDNFSYAGVAFYSVVSYMYAPGANLSSARYTMESVLRFFNGNTMQLEPISGSADSVHVQFDQVHDNNLNVMTPSAGYTFSTPTSATDVLYGSGRFVSGNTSPYTAMVNFSAVNWHGASRGSKVNLLVSIMNNQPAWVDLNNDPDLSLVAHSHTPNYVDTNLISIDVNAGDVVSLEFLATDFDMISMSPQIVSAYLNYGTIDGTGLIKPTLSPLAPQASLSSASTNAFTFNWTVPGGLSPGRYRFVVSAMDDHCGQIGRSSKIIEIHNSGIWQEEYDICSGDSVQLVAPFIGSSYEWIPSTGLSQTNAHVTKASPATTTTYTIKVDGDSVGLYTVNVGQRVTPVLSKPQPNQIQLVNPNDFDSYAFLYYYVPVVYNTPLLTTSAPGLYHAVGRNAGCYDLSDSTWITLDSLVSNHIVSAPLSGDEFVLFDNSSSYQMNANVGYFDAALMVDEIVIPGARVISSSGHLRLLATGYNGTVDTLVGYSLDGHSTIFPLTAPTFFTNGYIELQMENGWAEIPVVRGAQFPLNFDYGEVMSTSGVIAGDTISDGLIPFVFRGSNSIGEEEFGRDFTLYPQPSNQEIYIGGIEGELNYRILSLAGLTLSFGTTGSEGRISTRDLNTGMYILQIYKDEQVASFRIVVHH